ncbi:MAG: MarC family protein [Candidatus Omnitrophota bacterium]|jgi:multiple antibiotic resistance protein
MVDKIIFFLIKPLSPLAPFILSFIPVFVAVNAFGNLPLYIGLTEGMSKSDKKRVINKSILVATVVALLFIFAGKLALRLTGVEVFDFRIGGGILLLVLSVHLLLPGEEKKRHASADVGVFPLGTPLITGPAVLTTILIIIDLYGILPTVISILANMAISWAVLTYSEFFIKMLGQGGSRALAKVADIFLAAIAIMMIRMGILEIIVRMAAKK